MRKVNKCQHLENIVILCCIKLHCNQNNSLQNKVISLTNIKERHSEFRDNFVFFLLFIYECIYFLLLFYLSSFRSIWFVKRQKYCSCIRMKLYIQSTDKVHLFPGDQPEEHPAKSPENVSGCLIKKKKERKVFTSILCPIMISIGFKAFTLVSYVFYGS